VLPPSRIIGSAAGAAGKVQRKQSALHIWRIGAFNRGVVGQSDRFGKRQLVIKTVGEGDFFGFWVKCKRVKNESVECLHIAKYTFAGYTLAKWNR
jgi:hypothetical protein